MTGIHPILSYASVGFSTVFLIAGTIGNIYLFCKHVRAPFNTDPTFILLAFLRVADIISLYGWNLKNILSPFFKVDNETFSVLSCKLTSFFQFFSLKLSAWILVYLFPYKLFFLF